MRTIAILLVLTGSQVAQATTISGFVRMEYRVQGHSLSHDAGATFTLTADRRPFVHFDNFTVRDDDFNPVLVLEDFTVNFAGLTPVIDSLGNDCLLDIAMFYDGPALYLKVDGVPDISTTRGVLQYEPALIWLSDTIPEPRTETLIGLAAGLLYMTAHRRKS